MKIVGKQNVDYVNKSGKQVTGVTLHMTYPDNRIDGLGVDTCYVSSSNQFFNSIKNMVIGSEVDVLYDKRGYVYDVRLRK